MRTTCSLPDGRLCPGGLPDRNPSGQRPLLWTETLLPGQRAPWTETPCTETLLDRNTPLWKHNLRKLRLRAVVTQWYMVLYCEIFFFCSRVGHWFDCRDCDRDCLDCDRVFFGGWICMVRRYFQLIDSRIEEIVLSVGKEIVTFLTEHKTAKCNIRKTTIWRH